MKRRLFSFLMVVMIVCLAASMVVLSACDKTDPPAPEPDYSSDTTTMFKEVVQKLQASYVVGNKFGVDVDAHFAIDDKTEKNDDVKFALTAKGNADLANTQDASATDFFIELAMHKGEEKTTLLGIAYEVIENEPFFFVSVAGSEYIKLNGYSLTALYAAATGTAQSSAEILGFDVQEIISWVMPILFGEKGTVKDGVYTFNFDLANVMTSLNEASGMIFSLLESQAGITKEQVNGVIAQVFGNLEYTVGTKTYKVKDLNSLTEYVKREMSFEGTLAFAFDANDKFDSANISFDYAQKSTSVANYTFAVNKAKVGIDTVGVDTFANFTLTADQRKNNEAINALNFSLLGTATGFNANGEVAHNYTIEVQSDINPFALLSLVGNTSKENIVATLKKLGYFHLEINEVYEDETKAPLNIITLHSNFEEGFAVANVHTYGAIIYKAGVGGVYDFDALVDVIDMLVNKPSDPGEDPGTGEQPSQSIVDKIKDVVDTVKEYLAYFNFDNMTENGVTVELKNLVFHLLDSLGVDTDGIIGTGVAGLLGCNTMNVKLQTPTYNTCDERVATDNIVCTIREASGFKTGKNDFIKQIVSLDGFDARILQGDTNLNNNNNGSLELDKAFKITGINLKGEEVVTSGFIMGAKGFDANTVGKQTVTLYIAVANDLLHLAGAGLELGDDIPLSGALKFETEIEVVAFDEDAAVSTENVKTGTLTLAKGTKLFDKIQTSTSKETYIVVNDIKRALSEDNLVVLDKDGNNVTATVLVDDKLALVGSYSVHFEYAGYKTENITLNVDDAYVKRADGKEETTELVLGGTWDFSEYDVYKVTAAGEEKVDVETVYKLNNTTAKLTDIFDIEGGVYTVKKDLSFIGKTFKISHTVKLDSGNKVINIDIPFVCAEGYSVDNLSSIYFGNSINGKAGISVGEKKYSIVYNNGTFEFVAEDGSKLEKASVTLTWATRKINVEFNENGFIANYANKNQAGSRNEKIDYTITVGDYYYTSNAYSYELYASNVSSAKVDSNLNGKVSNVNQIYYVDANGEKQTLEFKYGAEGYAIYVKGTDTKIYDVAMTVTKDNAAVELVEGKFTEVGTYKVEYSININGINQTFFHTVTVK